MYHFSYIIKNVLGGNKFDEKGLITAIVFRAIGLAVRNSIYQPHSSQKRRA
jgi:hypothetical protein